LQGNALREVEHRIVWFSGELEAVQEVSDHRLCRAPELRRRLEHRSGSLVEDAGRAREKSRV
jgi:hypothetical protein